MYVAAKSHDNFIRQTAAPGRKTKETKSPAGFAAVSDISLCHSVAVIVTHTINEQDVASKAPILFLFYTVAWQRAAENYVQASLELIISPHEKRESSQSSQPDSIQGCSAVREV